MHVPSHILRRIAVIALLACAILSGVGSPATARPIDDPTLDTTHAASSTAAPSTSATGDSRDWTLPIVLTGAVVLLVAGTAGYSHRTRTGRRVTA